MLTDRACMRAPRPFYRTDPRSRPTQFPPSRGPRATAAVDLFAGIRLRSVPCGERPATVDGTVAATVGGTVATSQRRGLLPRPRHVKLSTGLFFVASMEANFPTLSKYEHFNFEVLVRFKFTVFEYSSRAPYPL
jgi:hypothetical protein